MVGKQHCVLHKMEIEWDEMRHIFQWTLSLISYAKVKIQDRTYSGGYELNIYEFQFKHRYDKNGDKPKI